MKTFLKYLAICIFLKIIYAVATPPSPSTEKLVDDALGYTSLDATLCATINSEQKHNTRHFPYAIDSVESIKSIGAIWNGSQCVIITSREVDPNAEVIRSSTSVSEVITWYQSAEFKQQILNRKTPKPDSLYRRAKKYQGCRSNTYQGYYY